ncbi:MAG: branched-chain amino acid transaminase [candidate division WOR-3 bacterium]
MNQNGQIWFNGKLVQWKEAKVHVLTHTLHYGLGVFEGIRFYKCDDGRVAIFRLDEHVNRLFDSARVVNIEIPFTKKEISSAIKKTIIANKLESGYIRPIVFIGDGAMGLYAVENPIHVAIAVWEWGPYLGDKGVKEGIKAKISSYTRHHVNASMTKAKICGYYVNSILAKREVIKGGYDEAILLDTEGYVAEASGENIFIVSKGVLKTTPPTAILPGITRDSVIKIARDSGIEVQEERFTRDELYIADEAFLTGTAAEITPVVSVDDRKIGNGKPGEITKQLQNIFFDIIRGRNKKYSHWLSIVE